MHRWGIILERQLLFTTKDEAVARRFMVMDGFSVIDHSTGYYAYMELQKSMAHDLLASEEIHKST